MKNPNKMDLVPIGACFVDIHIYNATRFLEDLKRLTQRSWNSNPWHLDHGTGAIMFSHFIREPSRGFKIIEDSYYNTHN